MTALRITEGQEQVPTIEEIRLAYPLKVKKYPTMRAIHEATDRIASERGWSVEAAARFLLDRVATYAVSDEGRGEYVPHPPAWFNDGRYDDDESAWSKRGVPRVTMREAAAKGGDS